MEYSQLKSFSASTLQGNWYEERLLTHERTVDNQPTQSRPFEPELPVERMKRIPHVPTSPLPNDGIVSYSTTSTDYRGEPKHQEKPVKTPILSEQNIAEIYNERSTKGNQAPFNETLPTHPPTHDARYFETSTHATYQKPAVPAHPRSTSKGSITAQTDVGPFELSPDLAETIDAHQKSRQQGHGRKSYITQALNPTSKTLGQYME